MPKVSNKKAGRKYSKNSYKKKLLFIQQVWIKNSTVAAACRKYRIKESTGRLILRMAKQGYVFEKKSKMIKRIDCQRQKEKLLKKRAKLAQKLRRSPKEKRIKQEQDQGTVEKDSIQVKVQVKVEDDKSEQAIIQFYPSMPQHLSGNANIQEFQRFSAFDPMMFSLPEGYFPPKNP